MYWFLFFVLLMGVKGQVGSHNAESETTTPNASTITAEPANQSTTPLTTSKPEAGGATSTPKHTTGSKPMSSSQSPHLASTPTACPEDSLCINDIKKPLPLIIIGGLAIACFTLLVVTLVLACNMCCLKRQISSSYQICSETAQPTDQSSTTRRESVNCEQSETHLLMNEISNGKPEGEEIQAEPKEPEKPEEAAKEAQAAEVPNQSPTEGSAQNEMPTTGSPPDQDFPPPMEDIAISE